jgi:hypothetical protein
VPQVWLTYKELGKLMNWPPTKVRRAVAEHGWSRRKSSDGEIRVKLSPTLAHEFMLNYAACIGSHVQDDGK